MGRTPDQFPGQRLEESIRFLSGTLLPTENGVMQYVSGSEAISGSGLYFNEEGTIVGPLRKLINTESHARVRQMIHLADSDGPFEDFSGAVKDTDTGIFSTGSIWFTDTNRNSKIIDKTITRTGILPTEIIWNVYDTDGETILNTATDVISYSGIFELSRTRTITPGSASIETIVESANNILWLDANDLSLGVGTTWIDRSTANNNGTFVASPTISDSWFGSRRTVTFNGTSQYLQANGVATSITGDDKPITVALVCRLTADNPLYTGIWSANNVSSTNPKFEFYKNNTLGAQFPFVNQGDTGLLDSDFAGLSTTDMQVIIVKHTGTTVSSWFNGVQRHQNVTNNANSKSLDLFQVGCLRRGGVAAFFAPLELSVVQVWDIALTDEQIVTQSELLMSQWGITTETYPAGGLSLWHVNNATLSGSYVTGIVDPIGGRDLIQTDITKRAEYNTTGSINSTPSIVFDGTNDVYQAVFVRAQPFARIVVAQCIDSVGTLVDGTSPGNNARIYYTGGTYRMYAGASGAGLISTTLTDWHVISAVFNGVSSYISVDAITGSGGNAGSSTSAGLTLGTFGNGTTDPAQANIVCVIDCEIANVGDWIAWANDGVF